MDKKIRVALYERVSTDEQKNSIEDQRNRLEYLALGNQWEIVNHYTDKGISGGTDSRPSLQLMMADARAGLFDLVAVTKIDRFMRETRLLLNYIDELDKIGVGFYSTDGIDTRVPGVGKVFLTILAVMAEFERERDGERQRENKETRAKQGGWIGGKLPFGYKFNKETKEVEINNEEAEAVRYIYYYYLKLNRGGVDKVIEHLNQTDLITPIHNKWTKSNVDSMLKREAYHGEITKTCLYKRPQIVDMEVWQAVQNKRKSSFRRLKPTRNEHMFNGLLKCGKCGQTVCANYSNKKPTYACNGRLKRFHLDGSEKCKLPIIRNAKEFDKHLSKQIIKEFSNPERLKKHLQDTIEGLEAEYNKLHQELYPLDTRRKRLDEDLEMLDARAEVRSITPEEYKKSYMDIKNQIKEIERKRDDIDTLKLLDYNQKKELVEHLKLVSKNMGQGKWNPLTELWESWVESPHKVHERIMENIKNIWGEEDAKALYEFMFERIDRELVKPRELLSRYNMKCIVHEDHSITLEGNIPIQSNCLFSSVR